MSIQIISSVFSLQLEDLTTDDGKVVSSSTCKFTLLALADHANGEGKDSYPSLALLEKKTCLSRQTVISAINALRKAGYIILEGTSRHGTNNYSIVIEKLVNTVDQGESTQLTRVVNTVDPNRHITRTLNRQLTNTAANKKNVSADQKIFILKCLEIGSAARFDNAWQYDNLLKWREEYGEERVIAALTYYILRGDRLGLAIAKMNRSIANWRMDDAPAYNSSRPAPSRRGRLEDLVFANSPEETHAEEIAY